MGKSSAMGNRRPGIGHYLPVTELEEPDAWQAPAISVKTILQTNVAS
jgi:hypothetical protein